MAELPADPVPRWLLGCWRLLRAEASLDFAPGVRMDFRPGGRLRYMITVQGREHVIELVYRVEGDTLRTDNPAAPHAAATRFSRGAGGVLEFDFAEGRAWFVRET
jgi:hypothetical protein